MMSYFIDSNIYVYPEFFRKIVELNLVNFDLWYLLESEEVSRRYYDLKLRYPKRNLVPFAKRDDIVCFEIGNWKLEKETEFN